MGTSSRLLQRLEPHEDHPHAYGDKVKTYRIAYRVVGSSPRVWGQEQEAVKAYLTRRIIPTRMGTSRITLRKRKDDWDHPHAYGDKRLWLQMSKRLSGSSPRVWGQACQRLSAEQSHRIIPTRMGTRMFLVSKTKNMKDHPHAYGDKWYRDFKLPFARGSSPRVWGQAL